jgi:hypothetical protein
VQGQRRNGDQDAKGSVTGMRFFAEGTVAERTTRTLWVAIALMLALGVFIAVLLARSHAQYARAPRRSYRTWSGWTRFSIISNLRSLAADIRSDQQSEETEKHQPVTGFVDTLPYIRIC